MTRLVRVVRYYEKNSDWPAGKLELPDIPLNELQRALSMPPEDDLYGVQIIDLKSANFFEFVLGVKFDFDKYDYHLDCYMI